MPVQNSNDLLLPDTEWLEAITNKYKDCLHFTLRIKILVMYCTWVTNGVVKGIGYNQNNIEL